MAVENKKMQQRRDTAANWTAANPILAAGEIGWESDTDQFKIGDGVNAWVDITDYYTPSTAGGIGGSTGATGDAILRADGAGGSTVQNSLATVDDNGTLNIPSGQAYQVGGNTFVTYNSGTNTATLGASSVSNTVVAALINVLVNISGTYKALFSATLFLIDTATQLVWGTAGVDGGDTGLGRFSAGVIKSTNAGTAITGFMGGGGAVASATALPLPTGRVFHVTGTTNITSITATNLASGVVITLIFDDILTFTDGNNLKLAGNFVTSADDTITLAYDGTNFYEIARSVN